MRPDSQSLRRNGQRPILQKQQRGFGLVAALFLIIVIAGAIAAMWRMSVTQTATNNLSLQQARAYQAARAGFEWGIWRFIHDDCPVSTPVDIDKFKEFQVLVECRIDEKRQHKELLEAESSDIVIQRIIATAQYSNASSPDYVYRSVAAEVEKSLTEPRSEFEED